MRFTLIIFTSLAFFNIEAQNLIANGCFIDRNICTEYNVDCGSEAWFFIPISNISSNNSFESLIVSNKPFEGNGIYTKLLCKLKNECHYELSIWLKPQDLSFDVLNIWIGSNEPGYKENSVYTSPSFVFTNNDVDSIKFGWLNLKYNYKATGNEQFILIGNLLTEPSINLNKFAKKPNIPSLIL